MRSTPHKGSVFTIEVPCVGSDHESTLAAARTHAKGPPVENMRQKGSILVVDDDPEVRDLLEIFLKSEAHHVLSARDGVAALHLVAGDMIQPDLILADYNLPGGLNGLQLTTRLREKLRWQVPVIILTGDISTDAFRAIAELDCSQLNKPVKLNDLTTMIETQLLAGQSLHSKSASHPLDASIAKKAPVIFVVDDDKNIRSIIRTVLENEGWVVEDFPTCEAFLDVFHPAGEACLLVDANLPGMKGIDLLKRLRDNGHTLPAIMVTGNGDVAMATEAMKAGASDFLEKPINRDELLAGITHALDTSRDSTRLSAFRQMAVDHVAGLTLRQREIMDRVLAGHPSKNIASDLGISQRTVENHRAAIMKKPIPNLFRRWRG